MGDVIFFTLLGNTFPSRCLRNSDYNYANARVDEFSQGNQVAFCQESLSRESLVWWKDRELCRKHWICILIPPLTCSETLYKEILSVLNLVFSICSTQVESHLACRIAAWNKRAYKYNVWVCSRCLLNAIHYILKKDPKKVEIKLVIIFFKSISFLS